MAVVVVVVATAADLLCRGSFLVKRYEHVMELL